MTATTDHRPLRVPLDTASSGGQDSNEPHLRPPAAYLPDSLLLILAWSRRTMAPIASASAATARLRCAGGLKG